MKNSKDTTTIPRQDARHAKKTSEFFLASFALLREKFFSRLLREGFPIHSREIPKNCEEPILSLWGYEKKTATSAIREYFVRKERIGTQKWRRGADGQRLAREGGRPLRTRSLQQRGPEELPPARVAMFGNDNDLVHRFKSSDTYSDTAC